MQYKGVEYSIVQLIDGSGWRWEIRFGEGEHKAGVTPVSRATAIKLGTGQQSVDTSTPPERRRP